MTQAKYACNLIEIAILDELLSAGKDLPNTWDQIPIIGDMKEKISTQNLSTLEHINLLALVPGAPLIYASPGISPDNLNQKLVAISRTAEVHLPGSKIENRDLTKGRYIILVSADQTTINSRWILESEAQQILEQIEGFDPIKQPFAFDGLEKLERDRKAAQEKLNQDLVNHLRGRSGIGQEDKVRSNDKESRSYRFFDILIWVVGSALIVCTVWTFKR